MLDENVRDQAVTSQNCETPSNGYSPIGIQQDEIQMPSPPPMVIIPRVHGPTDPPSSRASVLRSDLSYSVSMEASRLGVLLLPTKVYSPIASAFPQEHEIPSQFSDSIFKEKLWDHDNGSTDATWDDDIGEHGMTSFNEYLTQMPSS